MNRVEHLKWSKDRALAYLPDDPQQAFASMISDLKNHEELADHIGIGLGGGLMTVPGWISNGVKIDEFIRGFN